MIVLSIVRMILLIGVIMFIARGALSNCSKRGKGIGYFIVSSALFTISLVCLIVDIIRNIITIENIIFLIVSFLFMLYALYIIIKTKNFARNKVKMVYTLHNKNKYLYLIYKYNDQILLNKEELSGIKVKLKKNEFSDDILIKIHEHFKCEKSNIINSDRIGVLTVKGEKVDEIYYCYTVETYDEIVNDKYEYHQKTNVTTLNLNKIDKYIIFKSIIGKEFEDEI